MADNDNKINNPFTNPKSQNNQSGQKSTPSQEHPKKQSADLEKLSSQLNKHDDDNDDKKERIAVFFKRAMIILLILILLGGVAFAIFFFTKKGGTIVEVGTIKISTVVDTGLKDESGEQNIQEKLIYPGDKFSVRCVVRNSDNIDGDDNPNEYSKIFIRYSILVEVDGVNYNHVIVPVVPDLRKEDWHIYNPKEEVEDYVWDGFYYYYGALSKNQQLTIFDEIEFDFHDIPNGFGGKSATVTITVEAVHAGVDNLGVEGGDAWNTAPRRWINNMQKGINNYKNPITF